MQCGGILVCIMVNTSSTGSNQTSNPPALRYYSKPTANLGLKLDVDLCVFGGNSGGIIAAIAAKRRGLSVALLEAGYNPGGLTAGGLSLTDIGNKQAIGGLSRDFYRRVGKHYGMEEFWRFEPSVADKVFTQWLEEEGIVCHYESFLESVTMDGQKIRSLRTENGIEVSAKQFIDATYEGDLMAKAGVSFAVGREDNSLYGESLNGEQLHPTHQFELPVDPYRVEGDPASGLLPGIEASDLQTGRGDNRVQAYNFRLCLTNNAANRIPFTEPEGYDRADYELLARYCRAGYVPEFTKFDSLINDKVDMNNHGAVSSDLIGGNHDFPNATYAEREAIFQRHVQWIKGLLWFWTQDRDVPAAFKEKIAAWGWCRDEFVPTDGFSRALYVREARRLVGATVMTEHHCTHAQVAQDSIGLAAYNMDSHNCRRLVVDGVVRNEGDVQVRPTAPYPISYGALVPQRGECTNLFVPFCLSASHIAFGSIRMEPVFMILAQSCVEAAALAIELGVDSQDVPYPALRENLLRAGQVLDPMGAAKNAQTGE